MVNRELASRKKIRSLLPDLVEVVDDTDLDEEEYQCHSCRILCYLAQVTTISSSSSDGSKKIACADHFDTLEPGPKTIRLRYSDAGLLTVLGRVRQRAEKRVKSESFHSSQTTTNSGERKRKPSMRVVEGVEGDQEERVAQKLKVEPEQASSDSPALHFASLSTGGRHVLSFAPPERPTSGLAAFLATV